MFQLAEEAVKLLGLTVSEWLPLLAFGVAAIVNIIQAVKGRKDDGKLKAVVSAIEETAATHPVAVGTLKRVVRDKATKMGVQTGMFSLREDVKKHTQRLE